MSWKWMRSESSGRRYLLSWPWRWRGRPLAMSSATSGSRTSSLSPVRAAPIVIRRKIELNTFRRVPSWEFEWMASLPPSRTHILIVLKGDIIPEVIAVADRGQGLSRLHALHRIVPTAIRSLLNLLQELFRNDALQLLILTNRMRSTFRRNFHRRSPDFVGLARITWLPERLRNDVK